MEKEFKKVYVLGFEDEDGNHNTLCACSNKVVEDEEQKKEIRERLEEYLGLKEEDDEDAEILADFNSMVDKVLSGHTGYWLDYEVEWDEMDLIN